MAKTINTADIQREDLMVEDDFLKSAEEAGIKVEIAEVEDPNEGGIGGAEVFVPRLNCPTKGNRYYLTVGYGGLNKCILGKPQYCTGSALSNCVGYAWGRAYELLNAEPKLSRGNAENWWGYADGYQRGQTPKLGAIACWRKGQAGVASDGAGHVAVVEEINGNTIKLSNSGWGGSTFYLTTYTVGAMSHGAYTFQGFIYIGDFVDPKKKVVAEDGYWGTDTTKWTQRILGTTVDGIVSRQPRSNKKYAPNATTGWQWKILGYKGGSDMVRALQKLVGAYADGYFGKNTIQHLQLFLANQGLYSGQLDGSMGKQTVLAWQRFLNSK